MILGTTSNKLIEGFLETFERVFKIYPVPLYHLQWALHIKELSPTLKDIISSMVAPSSHRAFQEGMFIGQDFLIWLWYLSETNQNSITVGENLKATIFLGDKLVLVDPNEGQERVVCSTPSHKLEEARVGLKTGKRLQEAQWIISIDERDYSFFLDTSLWHIKNLKTPPQESRKSDDDPDGRFFEKMFFIEEVRKVLTLFYTKCLEQRFSSSWDSEISMAISEWMRSFDKK